MFGQLTLRARPLTVYAEKLATPSKKTVLAAIAKHAAAHPPNTLVLTSTAVDLAGAATILKVTVVENVEGTPKGDCGGHVENVEAPSPIETVSPSIGDGSPALPPALPPAEQGKAEPPASAVVEAPLEPVVEPSTDSGGTPLWMALPDPIAKPPKVPAKDKAPPKVPAKDKAAPTAKVVKAKVEPKVAKDRPEPKQGQDCEN